MHMKKTLTFGSTGLDSTVRNREILSLGKLVLLAGAFLFSLQVVQAQVLYREVFGNSTNVTSANNLLSTVGWSGAWGPTATDSSSPSPNNFGISSSVGSPINLDNVNAGGPAASMQNGFIFTSGTGASLNNWIAYGTGSVDPNQIQDISFYAGSAANGANGIPGARVAVQVDGNWYVSAQVLANTVAVSSGANFSANAQQEVFNWTTAPSAWYSLSFTPGTTLALGSLLTSPLPTDNNLTAFGLYSDQEPGGGNATRRFDTFQIDAVPEPGSVLLALLGAGLLIKLRPSRKA